MYIVGALACIMYFKIRCLVAIQFLVVMSFIMM